MTGTSVIHIFEGNEAHGESAHFQRDHGDVPQGATGHLFNNTISRGTSLMISGTLHMEKTLKIFKAHRAAGRLGRNQASM